jgi:superfamily II DNA/RNA helicase
MFAGIRKRTQEFSLSTFLELGVSAEIAEQLSRRGITAPFPIQRDAIAAGLAGRDVCGRAPTGSGKTLAFGIPLAQRVTRGKPSRPRALVLVPTRELAAQVERELRPLAQAHGLRTAAFYGGMSFVPQLKALRRSVDIVIGCPGRVADLVRRGNMSLADVQAVVVDEADRMADMGFLPEVRRLLDQVRPDRQTLLFSATLDGEVDVLIRSYQRDPLRVSIADTAADIDRRQHVFVDTAREQRTRVTADLVARHGQTVVFCRTKHGVDRLAKQLNVAGVRAVTIHGNRSQSQRERALATFVDGKANALIATDVAARGIHVDDIACVVHFDLPADAKDYVHRSGRTARAGADGVVVTLVTPDIAGAARKLRAEVGHADTRPSDTRPSSPSRERRPAPSNGGRGVRQRSARTPAGRRGTGRPAAAKARRSR